MNKDDVVACEATMDSVWNGLVQEASGISPAAWRRLRPSGAATSTVPAGHRPRGKSWAPFLCVWGAHARRTLEPTPAEALADACRWALQDTGKPPVEIFAGPRVFPVLKPGKRVA